MSMSLFVFVPFLLGVFLFIGWASSPKEKKCLPPSSTYRLIKITISRFLKIFFAAWIFSIGVTYSIKYYNKIYDEALFKSVTQPNIQTCNGFLDTGKVSLYDNCIQAENEKAESTLTIEYANYANSPMVDSKKHFWNVDVNDEIETMKAYIAYMKVAYSKTDSQREIFNELEEAVIVSIEEKYKSIAKLKSPFNSFFIAIGLLILVTSVIAGTTHITELTNDNSSKESFEDRFKVLYEYKFTEVAFIIVIISILFF